MKNLCKLTIVALAMSALVFGCQPEGVGPEGRGQAGPTIKAAEGEDPHPALDPVCGEARTYILVSEDGSELVNRCFGPTEQGSPIIACSSPQPAWGTVTAMNGLTDFIANVDLAEGWVGQAEYVRTAPSDAYTFATNGFPIVTNDWTLRVINPIVGKWQVARSLTTTGSNFGLGIKLTVAKLTLAGDVIPNSTTTLWLRDPQAETTVASPYIAEWNRNYCTPAWPSTQTICKVVDVGAPALTGCIQLEPALASPVGIVTYTWSTGATASSITVCPSTATSYMVSITDESGPRAVYQYDVNLRNIACTVGSGNTQDRVSICHIPPGNPSSAHDLCVDWDNVRHHVASFRTYVTSQDHNSGCNLGLCGTNPCSN